MTLDLQGRDSPYGYKMMEKTQSIEFSSGKSDSELNSMRLIWIRQIHKINKLLINILLSVSALSEQQDKSGRHHLVSNHLCLYWNL